MISKKDLGKKFQELVSHQPQEADENSAMENYLKFLVDNYDEFDDEAKEAVDKFFSNLLGKEKEAVEKMPDGREKWEFLRIVRQAEGENYNAELLLTTLERKSVSKLELVSDTRETFTRGLQYILNFAADISEKPQSGMSDFAKFSLFALCTDELLTAFHLAQHFFVNQTYSHIRTVFEILDKIELFQRQPEWVSLWCSESPEDKKKILTEFSPASVREKLGKKRFDEGYSFFSELGPHATWQVIQLRSGKNVDVASEKLPQFKVWIGGSPFEHHAVWVNTFLLYTVSMVVLKITQVFSDRLNNDETIDVLKEMTRDYKSFMVKHFLSWAKQVGLDTQPMIDEFNSPLWPDNMP